MAIPQAYVDCFETLVQAVHDGNLALVEGKIAETGQIVYLVAAINSDGTIVPFGHLCSTNPYEFYLPPLPEGGFKES